MSKMLYSIKKNSRVRRRATRLQPNAWSRRQRTYLAYDDNFSLNIWWLLDSATLNAKFSIELSIGGVRCVIPLHTNHIKFLGSCVTCHNNNSFSIINTWNIQSYFYDVFDVWRQWCALQNTSKTNFINSIHWTGMSENRLEIFIYWYSCGPDCGSIACCHWVYSASTNACHLSVLMAFTMRTMALS